ncbi:MAG: hypothetical protein KJ905_03250 [Nanoarchaeota archaeon]|nr:hypothetical protein [Nanoarchaeota archaeon]MBU1501765.1 hypothetical protein [Nanoarchaeota archaeon]MBU2458865.1 hypothetical protein [Nanoarchaeota archaeon]
MNLQFYFEKLNDSDDFKKFFLENPEAYFCSGFFTIDFEGQDNQRHIDYYVPTSKKIISFRLDSSSDASVVMQEARPDVEGDFPAPEKLNDEIDFDFDEIQKIIREETEKKEKGTKVNKMLISLQKRDGKESLVCTVFVSRFGLLKINIDFKGKDGTPEIVFFKKKSLFDLVRKGD